MLSVVRLFSVLAGGALQRTGRRVARVSLLLVVALLFALFGLTGFAVAAFILLARVMDPALAALLMGGVSFLIAAILLLVAQSQGNRQPLVNGTPEEDALRQQMAALMDTASKTGPWLPLGLAVLGGFMVTRRRR